MVQGLVQNFTLTLELEGAEGMGDRKKWGKVVLPPTKVLGQTHFLICLMSS